MTNPTPQYFTMTIVIRYSEIYYL